MKFAAAILALLLLAGSANACPSCSPLTKTTPNNSARTAVIISGVGMLILPAGMVTGLVVWLRRSGV